MVKRAVAVACLLALCLCGCNAPKVQIVADDPAATDDAAPESVELTKAAPDIPERLIEELPVEVEFDGISFRVPAATDGWGEPYYSDVNPYVFVMWNGDTSLDDEDNVIVDLQKLQYPEGSETEPILNIGTDLPDADYINAGMDYLKQRERAGADRGAVYEGSGWEVRHDPGGIVCSCFYGMYYNPEVTHRSSIMISGDMYFIFTDHGQYIFDVLYEHGPGNEEHYQEMLPTMLDIERTLYVGRDD